MISYLTGTVFDKGPSAITLLTAGGVGYRVGLAPNHVGELLEGQKIALHTYLRVSDSSHDLFGFRDKDELDFFSLLLTVSGIGPKSAMSVLSLGSIDDIQSAIAREDVSYLTSVQGMGKKTAERLVVELKTKIDGVRKTRLTGDEGAVGDTVRDVIDGLIAMGYSKEDARDAAVQSYEEGKSVEAVLREALKKLSR